MDNDDDDNSDGGMSDIGAISKNLYDILQFFK